MDDALLTISKTPALDYSQDYNFLRAQGLKYIEELGSSLWTDYNEHDPGITILEALCYAITELGYRSGMPVQNLLADKDGKLPLNQTFYTANNILTQVPLTINDYRKLLIDIVGIHNAWFFTNDYYTNGNVITVASEVPVFADCKLDKLTYETTSQPVYLSGLYRVILDLDNDLQFGDLNNGKVTLLTPAVIATPPAHSFKAGAASLTIALPEWDADDVSVDALNCDATTIEVAAAPEIIKVHNDLQITITFACDKNASVKVTGFISVDLQPPDNSLTDEDIISFFSIDFTKQLIYLYVLKIQKAKNAVQLAKRTLLANRNLCEDFVSVTTVKDEEIAVCCDIDVAPAADIEDVQAKVFYAIEEYFNPTLKFYTLDELIKKGKRTDEIFEGPKLTHGFIDTDELEATELREKIYSSDIINKLMDIEGVIAVRSFRLTKYNDDGDAVPNQKGRSWCIPVTTWSKPVFSETKSKIIFYKNQFTYLPSLSEVRDILKWLRALGAQNKLSGHTPDINLPAGIYMPLDQYTPLQQLFPLTYGIGRAGLPPGASDERKAQAKQLKAYLMFYDQLLADFFSQLKNAGALFSATNTVQTYYAQFLDNIPGNDVIYGTNSSGNSLQSLLSSQDSTIAPPNAISDWEKLYESNETFNDRRNRFLDHLMARFGESFNEYVLLMYQLDYHKQQELKIEAPDLLNSKINFLKNYPQLSYERDKAFNYLPQNDDLTVNTSMLWDTDNVAGIEKKLSFLGGFKKPDNIESYYRRFLYCSANAVITTTGETPPKYGFSFFNKNGDQITSPPLYDTEEAVTEASLQLVDYILNETNVGIKENSGNWQILFANNNGDIIATSNNFSSEADADAALKQFSDEIDSTCDSNGLHLVEHILLRPRNNSFFPAQVCLNQNCDFCGEQDPYSFRISIVLPYWPAHFRSLAFRAYFEDLVRRESPAHTTVKVCWLSNTNMYLFENAYKAWITALANYSLDATADNVANDFQAANDSLVKLIFNLNSEYPVATLHSCSESEDDNSVILGKTILGSFKN